MRRIDQRLQTKDRRLKKTILVFLVMAWLFVSYAQGSTQAADYYVDQNHPSASDSNPGTEELPLKTIQKGVDLAQPGDTVWIKGSTDSNSSDAVYSVAGSGIITRRPGQPGKPITISSYPGNTVIIEGNGTGYGIDLTNGSHHTFQGLIFRNFRNGIDRGIATTATNILMERLEFTQTTAGGLYFGNINNLTMRDSYVHHCKAGIWVTNRSDNVTFERVESAYNGINNTDWGSADGFATNNALTVNFIDCVARYNWEDGYDLNSNSTLTNCVAVGNGLNPRGASNVKCWRRKEDNYALRTYTIINCILNGSGEANIVVAEGSSLHVYNSSLYGSGYQGIIFYAPDAGVAVGETVNCEIINTIIAGNGRLYSNAFATEVQNPNPANFTYIVHADHNLYFNNAKGNSGLTSDINAINGQDPLFFGPASGDFHLKPQSPAVDVGCDLSTLGVTGDFDGTSRPQDGNGDGIAAYDIGPYERVVMPGYESPEFVVPNQTSFTINEGETLSANFEAENFSGDNLVFFIDSVIDSNGHSIVMNEVNIDRKTGQFSFTPNFAQGGNNIDPTSKTYYVKLGVTGELYQSPNYLDITVNVHNVNRPPAYDGLARYTLIENQLCLLTLGVLDPDDGDNVTVELVNSLPGNVSFDNTKARISWTPTSGQIGTHEAIFNLRDNFGSETTASVTFEVLPKALFAEPINPDDIFFVDGVNGNDTNDGQTEGSAWKTIQKAKNTLKSGQMVFVRGGTYNEYGPIANSGIPGEPIIFKAFPGEKVIMDGDGFSSSQAFDFTNNNSYIVIDGFEFSNFTETIYFHGNTNGVRILNCNFHDSTPGKLGYGIIAYGDDLVIENCKFDNIAGLAIYGGISNVHILDTTINNAARRGIYIKDYDNLNISNCKISGCGELGIMADVKNSLIINSEVKNNTGTGIYVGRSASIINSVISTTKQDPNSVYASYNIVVVSERAEIINSVIALSEQIGLYVSNGAKSCSVVNSIFYKNSGVEINGMGYDSLQESHNIFYDPSEVIMVKDASSRVIDPNFVNAESGDFHLKGGSPAINTGLDMSSLGIATDLEGNSRPRGAGYDIGAYEYSPQGKVPIMGDVNDDSVVDAVDVQASVNNILGTQDWAGKADVNKDSVVNSLDIQAVVNIILGV